MRVFGWAADKGGCGYYRVARPFKELRDQYGWDAPVGTSIGLDDADLCDLIVTQRTYLPPNSEWLQQQDPARIVYEIDDDLWQIHPLSPAHAVFEQPATRDALTANIRHAGTVTVSTDALADVIRPINPNVVVLPNYVDAAMLDWERPRRPQLTIGWAGSATHINDFREAVPTLQRVMGKYRGRVEMHIISELDYSLMIRKGVIHLSPWVKGVVAYHKTIDFDIGIAPLASDPFNASKSAIKALEYAALGIPIVASDFGPYREFVKDGVTGFLCRNDHDWFRALRMLIEDSELRETMGKAAKEQASQHTVQGNAWRWREVYQRARG